MKFRTVSVPGSAFLDRITPTWEHTTVILPGQRPNGYRHPDCPRQGPGLFQDIDGGIVERALDRVRPTPSRSVAGHHMPMQLQDTCEQQDQ